MSAMMRETIELMAPGVQILVNQQGDQVVLAVETWDDDGERRLWSRVELNHGDAAALGAWITTYAARAMKQHEENERIDEKDGDL
jgi:hypothetical protein